MRARLHRPSASLLLACLVLLGAGCGADEGDGTAQGARAAVAPPAVPIAGGSSTTVVGASSFQRFHLLTTGDALSATLLADVPAAVGEAARAAQAHLDAHRLRSAARGFESAATAARGAARSAAEEDLLLRELDCQERLGEHERMLAVAARILELREARRDGLAAARSRCDLGAIYGMLGNHARAFDNLVPAAEAFRRYGSPRRRAHALATIGLVHLRRAEYGPALDVLEEAAGLLEDTRDRSRRAYVLNLQGCLYQGLGDAGRARELFDAARALYGDESSVDSADVLGNVGSMHFHRGEADEAARCYEQARAIYDAHHDALGASKALFSLGRVRKVQGGYRTALEVYREALALQETGSSDAVRTRCAIAETYLAMGEPKEALLETEDALGTVDAGTARIVRVELLVVHALALLRTDATNAAVTEIRRALDVLHEVATGLADEHVVGLRERRGWVFDTGVAVALETGRADLAAEFLEHGRAGALLEGLGGRGSRRGLAPELEQVEQEASRRLAAANRRYVAARAARQRDELRAASQELDDARSAYRTVQQRIQREARRVASVFDPVPRSLAEVRRVLPRGDVLVLYAMLPVQAYALVVTPEAGRIVWLGNTEDVHQACEALRAGAPDDPAAGAPPLAERIARLRRATVDPLDLPAGTRRLLLSPDGSLCYVPFPLLFEAQPELEIACLPSGTTLCMLAPERGRSGEHVLALGDPHYVIEHQGRSLQMYAEGAPLEPLPATRREVTAVTGAGDQRLLGTQATVHNLQTVAATRPRWSVIHFACHGLIDPATPTLSALALTPEPGDDGFLTALEVYGMQLPADLVVLSGCNTGRGRYVKGEGLVGLMRAFMCAGAPRVVVSLWKVDDEATQALMTRFHQLWRGQGLPTSRALRMAQAEIRAQPRWGHPRYWAAWVLWGLVD